MPIIYVRESDFDSIVNSNDVVILDFYANWCGPCRMLGEVLEEISYEHPELVVGKINVDDERSLANKFSIRSIPQLYIYKKGELFESITGYISKEDLLEVIK